MTGKLFKNQEEYHAARRIFYERQRLSKTSDELNTFKKKMLLEFMRCRRSLEREEDGIRWKQGSRIHGIITHMKNIEKELRDEVVTK